MTVQYCISPEASQGVTVLIQDLGQWGIIQKTHSSYSSPIWPVCKSNSTWCLTVDCHKLNENTGPLHAALPSVMNLIFSVEQVAQPWMGALDIKEMFSTVPLQPED